MNLFRKKKKQERPFLKLCEACHGKGQLSYFDIAQKKKYGGGKEGLNIHISLTFIPNTTSRSVRQVLQG